MDEQEKIIGEIMKLNRGREDIDVLSERELRSMHIGRLRALLDYTRQLRGK